MNFFENKESVKAKKSLVIYFSHTGENYLSDGIRNIEKGNTEVIAEMIQDITGADLFKVEQVKEYPYNYQECCDVAKKELQDKARPEIKKTLENIDEYEVIYIGFPIWWETMPMPIFTQLEKLNFEGKIVKPFGTHEGSRMGSSEKDVKDLCKGAMVLAGLPIQGSTVNSAKAKVEDWVK